MRRLHRLAVLGMFVLLEALLPTSKGSGEEGALAAKRHRSAFSKYVTVAGAERVGSEACLACHSESVGAFRHSLHSQQGLECEDCHGAGSLHVQAGDGSNTISFRQASAEAANGACLSCHSESEHLRRWSAGPHSSSGLRCIDCHQTHGAASGATGARASTSPSFSQVSLRNPGSLVPERRTRMEGLERLNSQCLRCHPTQRAEMGLPYHHPLLEGKIACLDCHDPHASAGRANLRAGNVNELCLTCHAQYQGPFAYQHTPVNESCLKCHTPHGSPNMSLLTVSQPALCLQCHAAHHNGSGLPLVDTCTNCHSSIHGTDIPSATGGSKFVDKGSWGVPSIPGTTPSGAHGSPVASRPGQPVSRISLGVGAMSAQAAHASSVSTSDQVPLGGGQGVASPSADSYVLGSVLASPYRILGTSGYGGRVGQYDTLDESPGAEAEFDYVSVPKKLVFLSRGNLITPNDYHLVSELRAGTHFQAGLELRSFSQQQDHLPFYADTIAPDIGTTQTVPSSTFGVRRTFNTAYARLQIPDSPVTVFVKGGWQTRQGLSAVHSFDMGGDADCGSCHFSSQLQSLDYTTWNLAGGADIKLGRATATWQHDYTSFQNHAAFPISAYGAVLPPPGEDLPPGVSGIAPGNYAHNVLASHDRQSDTLRLHVPFADRLNFSGDVSYARDHNSLTGFPQNLLNAYSTLGWDPIDRLRITLNYLQQSLINGFVPFYTQYGNTSYHRHQTGLEAEYGFTKTLNVGAHYERMDMTRSNAFLWPQVYSPNNSDPLMVVPATSSDTAGLILRFTPDQRWRFRLGYDWTGTQNPGYVTDPRTNHALRGGLSLAPAHWILFSNDTSLMLQRGFTNIQRKNDGYTTTSSLMLSPVATWTLDLGYSYWQDNLATDMLFNTDAGAGYLYTPSLVPYRQLSQSYWVRSNYTLRHKLQVLLGLTHSSASGGLRPDAAAAALAGVPQEAIDAVMLGATTVSQVAIPQTTAQVQLDYLFQHQVSAGVLFTYGSYADQFHPNLDGRLRTVSIFIGRAPSRAYSP